MANKMWTDRISKKMKMIDREFCNNELAYLALTSKVERPIVDKLAFCLHRDYYAEGHIAREWTKRNQYQRGDLAVIVDGAPKLILEAKAMYSFDMFAEDAKTKYPERVKKDVKKMQNFKPGGQVERLAMILLTDTDTCPNDGFSGIVKYMNRLKSPKRDFDELKSAVQANFCEFLPRDTKLDFGSICGRSAFGMQVTVHYCLFGPFPASESAVPAQEFC